MHLTSSSYTVCCLLKEANGFSNHATVKAVLKLPWCLVEDLLKFHRDVVLALNTETVAASKILLSGCMLSNHAGTGFAKGVPHTVAHWKKKKMATTRCHIVQAI